MKKIDRCSECHITDSQFVESRIYLYKNIPYCAECMANKFIFDFQKISVAIIEEQQNFWKSFASESLESINLAAEQAKKILVLMAEVANKDREIAELKGKLKKKK